MSDKQAQKQFGEAESRIRGQIDPRLIIGLFVLFVIAGPLIAVGVNIQSALESTPAFSEFAAGVIALLIVAAMAAAALGLE